MKSLSRTFLTGLVTVLPLVGTFYLVFWLAGSAEALLGRGLRLLLPDEWYWPGSGVLLGVVIVFMAGLFMRTWVARRIFMWWEGVMMRVPVVKSIYGALRDFIGLFSESKERRGQQVVAMRWGDGEVRLLGFVTRADLRGVPGPIGGEGRVAVYFPMSYQVGGYTAFVPRHLLEPVDMSFEEAMRFVLTAAAGKAPAAPEGR